MPVCFLPCRKNGKSVLALSEEWRAGADLDLGERDQAGFVCR